jgi:hypothetical protein
MSSLHGAFCTLFAAATWLWVSGAGAGSSELTGDAAALLEAEREADRPSAAHDATRETEPSTSVWGDSQRSSAMSYDSTGCRGLVDAIRRSSVWRRTTPLVV